MANARKSFELVNEHDFLAREAIGEVRHELVDGIMYAMAGGTDRAARIALDFASALNLALPQRCLVYTSDMKLRIATAVGADFYYPDVAVFCGPSDPTRTWREKPTVIAEVLSPRTERTDRTEKFDAYTALDSLQEYLLISQDEMRVEIYRRATGWQREVLESGDILALPSVEFSVSVAQLYRRAEL